MRYSMAVPSPGWFLYSYLNVWLAQPLHEILPGHAQPRLVQVQHAEGGVLQVCRHREVNWNNNAASDCERKIMCFQAYL